MEIIAKVLDNSYPIIIDRNVIRDINKYFIMPNKVLVVYDENVDQCFLDNLTSNILSEVYIFTVKGEESKNFCTYKALLETLMKNNFTRSDLVISLGGGATSDICGFVSGTYKRGLNLIHIPTTTLAMVDASVGGKCAIDFKGVKNSVGMFYLPKLVLIDLDTLNSLPDNLFNEGLVEALKCGLIGDRKLIELLKDTKNIKKNLVEIIYRAIMVKNYYVSIDFYDKSERKYLNFGHTLAHALEAHSEFNVLHGEAVAYGMVKLLKGSLKEETKKILDNLGVKYDYDVKLDDLMPFVLQDKKKDDDYLSLVLLDEANKPYIKKIEISEIKSIVNE